jgi:hypothetical protein
MVGGASWLNENEYANYEMVINVQCETMQKVLVKRVPFFWHVRKGRMKLFQVVIIKRG